jgi:hypothetical protein
MPNTETSAAPRNTEEQLVLRVVEAGFFRSNENHPAAQMYAGEWWLPRFGCDSLAVCMGEVEEMLTQNASLHRTEPAAGSGTVRGLVGASDSEG